MALSLRILKRHFQSDGVFSLLIAGIILIGRIPTWAFDQCGTDEAQWLAGCVTLSHGYGFWRVDGTTSGPLVIQFLWLWNLLWGANTFEAAKVLTTVVSILIVVITYHSIRTFCSVRVAQAIILPFVVTFALFRSVGYVGYNGEQVSILLLASAAYLLLSLIHNVQMHFCTALFLGAILGLVPYSKLQTVPIGMLLGLFSMWTLRDKKQLWHLLIGVCVTSGAPLVVLASCGQLNDFILSYLAENAQYAASFSTMPFVKRLYAFPLAWLRIQEGRALVISGLLFILMLGAIWLAARQKHRDADESVMIVSVLYLGVAAYCIAQPGTFFPHYYLFMFHPLMLSMSSLFSSALRGTDIITQNTICYCWSAIALAGVLGTYVSPGGTVHGQSSGGLQSLFVGPVAEFVSANSEPDFHLSVWGWACHLHVQTQLPQATSESHTFRQITAGKYQDYFMWRHLQQMQETADRLIFVDATNSAESMHFKGPQFSHENYADVKRFVDSRLVYLGTVNGCRVYRSSKDSAL